MQVGGGGSGLKVRFQIVNVGDLEKIDAGDKEVDAQLLYEKGIIHSPKRPVKVLGGGEITKPVIVKADAYSQTAREKLRLAKATVR